jgi:hypothetical protein
LDPGSNSFSSPGARCRRAYSGTEARGGSSGDGRQVPQSPSPDHVGPGRSRDSSLLSSESDADRLKRWGRLGALGVHAWTCGPCLRCPPPSPPRPCAPLGATQTLPAADSGSLPFLSCCASGVLFQQFLRFHPMCHPLSQPGFLSPNPPTLHFAILSNQLDHLLALTNPWKSIRLPRCCPRRQGTRSGVD